MLLRADPELAGWRLTGRRLAWLGAAIVLAVAPHALRLPAWIPILFLALCAWRGWRLAHGQSRAPARWLVAIIGLGVLPGVYLSFGTLTGRHAGVALLTLLAATKLLETRSMRDGYVLVFLGFFLLASSFLFSQSLLLAVYAVPVTGVMIAAMMVLAIEPRRLPAERAVTHAGRRRVVRCAVLLVQAIPLMALLFVLFPRIPGPLWGLPKDAHSAVTGLGEDMSPGDISTLSQSDEIAFRVRFDGEPPRRAELYWRGPVLTASDGRRWTQVIQRAERRGPLDDSGRVLSYQIELEPAAGHVLPALDYALDVPPGARITDAHSLRLKRRLTRLHRYRLRSRPGAQLLGRPADREHALELPAGAHPRAVSLGQRWRREVGEPRRVVARALELFARGGFSYTLTPPLLPRDPVDDFLFGTRQGFCEHYAAAFTVLMRAAGVPARVVAGYQGGEMNPLGGYMLVRQRDAHAWSEVWLEGRGWVRVDPTAAVAPERIDRGMDAAIAPIIGPRALGLTAGEATIDVLRGLRNTLDLIEARWNAWVLGYGPERQRDVLQQAGLGEDVGDFALLSVIALALVMGLLAVWLLRRPVSSDPVRALYLRFCAKLARRGLERAAHEGPLDYAARISTERPDLSAAVNAITQRYIELRYGGRSDGIHDLEAQVRIFRA